MKTKARHLVAHQISKCLITDCKVKYLISHHTPDSTYSPRCHRSPLHKRENSVQWDRGHPRLPCPLPPPFAQHLQCIRTGNSNFTSWHLLLNRKSQCPSLLTLLMSCQQMLYFIDKAAHRISAASPWFTTPKDWQLNPLSQCISLYTSLWLHLSRLISIIYVFTTCNTIW